MQFLGVSKSILFDKSYNAKRRRNSMFQVRQTEEMINKTFRMPSSLLDELTKIAEQEKISVNNLVRQCCEYALSNMKTQK